MFEVVSPFSRNTREGTVVVSETTGSAAVASCGEFDVFLHAFLIV